MAELELSADVDRPSARWRRLGRRRWLIAVLFVAAAIGIYAAWPRHHARLIWALTEEFGQLPGREFRASERGVTCHGIAITDEIARDIGSVRTISAIDFSACPISSDGLKSITSLPELTSLSIVDCRLIGSGKSWFGTSQSLIQVTLRNITGLAGSDLAAFLSEQPHLETLVLDHIGITDSDLKGWTASTELSRAVIKGPGLYSSGAHGFDALPVVGDALACVVGH
ncbi:MAG TPA: hypothetical protein VGP76_02815 [Planctomycetaceae bacterium]|jgi:hypothetical protein|nr:hypothetical protein [Planctomycetaceae bacterium]